MNVKGNEHKQLSHGCYRTEIAVHPTNWQKQKAKIIEKKKPVEWYVWYRFFDPLYKEKYPFGKPIKRRGMNKFADLASRQVATEEILALEKEKIDQKYFNPITEKYMQPPAPVQQAKDTRPITPNTGLIAALDWAYENLNKAPGTLDQIRYTLGYTWLAAEKLGLEGKAIRDVEKADMRLIIDKIGQIKNSNAKLYAEEKGEEFVNVWTASTFNHCKANLGMLFFALEEYDVYKVSPLLGIKKRKGTKNIRETLDDQQFKEVDKARGLFL